MLIICLSPTYQRCQEGWFSGCPRISCPWYSIWHHTACSINKCFICYSDRKSELRGLKPTGPSPHSSADPQPISSFIKQEWKLWGELGGAEEGGARARALAQGLHDTAPRTPPAHHETQVSTTEAHPKTKPPVVSDRGTEPFPSARPSQAVSSPSDVGRIPETQLTPAPKASPSQRQTLLCPFT